MREDRDKKRVILQIKRSFQSVYLTLISIIQASVLGYLIFVVYNNIDKLFDSISFVLAVTSFLIIILIWNEYMMGSTIFRWIPGLKDSFIPFGLGVSEIVIISYIYKTLSSWAFSMSVFCAIGFLAYLNMFYSSKNHIENKYIFGLLGKLPKITMIWALIEAVMCVLLGITSKIFIDILIIQQTIAIIFLISIIAFLLRARLYWNKIIK